MILLDILLSLLILIICILVIGYYVNNVIKNRQFRSCVINLERNQEKLSEFKNNYKLPIKLEVFKAVDAKKLSMKHLHKHGVVGDYGMECILRGDKYYHHELTPGAVGCYLSHVHLWKKMVDEKISCMIIFEDDAIVNNVDLMELNMRLNELPKNWHMYMIGNPHSIVEVNQINSEGLDKMSRFCGLHAYVLNYEGAKYLLENGKLFPMNQQIDMHVSELAQEHGFNIYFHQNKSLINMSSEGSSDVQIIPLRELSWERLRV